MIAFIDRLYRMLFCHGGYGVHSPFVFDLITNVIEEQMPYYCYEQLHTVRLQLLQDKRKITVRNRTISEKKPTAGLETSTPTTVRNRTMTIKKAINRYCFTEPEDRLLFRLANYFQPKTIFIAGSHFGLTPLYLTAYSKDTTCIVIESEPSIAAIAQEYIKKYAAASIVFPVVEDKHFESPGRLDFIVWSHSFTSFPIHNPTNNATLPQSDFIPSFDEALSLVNFDRFLSYINDESVMVISGIHASSNDRKVWNAICVHPKVTVTIDLYRFGIVFFNPKYHQQTYKSVVC